MSLFYSDEIRVAGSLLGGGRGEVCARYEVEPGNVQLAQ